MAILIISATPFETKPLLDVLTMPQKHDFPLGSLYQGQINQKTIYLAHLGIGKVNTAAGLALAITQLKPSYVIQVGIGGAFVGSFLSIGMVAVATKEIHLDSGIRFSSSWQDMKAMGFPLLQKKVDYFNEFPTDINLAQRFSDCGAYKVIFGTSEAVTGDFDLAKSIQTYFDVSVESMEGAAAAQTCLALDTPFAELRGVSNMVGERDKIAWNIPLAIANVNNLVLKVIKSW